MPMLRLSVPNAVIDGINHDLAVVRGDEAPRRPLSANDIGREALGVYKWFVEQVRVGKAVGAIDPDVTHFVQIATPRVPARVSLCR